MPCLMEADQRIYKGLFSSFLQVLRSDAGIPSGPAADVVDSSLQAPSISSSVKSMSHSMSLALVLFSILKNSEMSSISHSGLG